MPHVPSRAERQQQTRDALVLAARSVFSRDGFHAARLEDIAREAGYSKGAVYSNFEGKAELFLAAIDLNLASLREQGWDPAAGEAPSMDDLPEGVTPADVEAAVRGFALATLEFIAAAARDERLTAEMAERYRWVIGLHTEAAEGARSPDDPLSTHEIGALMTALDQGAALLTMAGIATLDDRLVRAGLARLSAPASALDGGAAEGLRADDGPDSLTAMGEGTAGRLLRDAIVRDEP